MDLFMDSVNWLLFHASYLSLEQRNWIGFFASLGCFAMAAYFANEVKNSPRLFTVVALFSGAWVALASSYQARLLLPPPNDVSAILSDRAGDLASFVTVFAGAVLAREGDAEHWFLNSQRLQVAAMSLLAALVFPRQFSPEWITLVVGGALSLVGFLALGLGAKAVAKPPHFASLVIILVVYAMLDTGRTLQVMLATQRPPPSDFFTFSFTAAKILLTLSFCYIVLRHHRFGGGKGM